MWDLTGHRGRVEHSQKFNSEWQFWESRWPTGGAAVHAGTSVALSGESRPCWQQGDGERRSQTGGRRSSRLVSSVESISAKQGKREQNLFVIESWGKMTTSSFCFLKNRDSNRLLGAAAAGVCAVCRNCYLTPTGSRLGIQNHLYCWHPAAQGVIPAKAWL